jgi:hypothetical protein
MSASLDPDTDLAQWQTFDDFSASHANFQRGQIEWLYRRRASNGLTPAFRRIGRRRYVHLGRFAELLLEGKG